MFRNEADVRDFVVNLLRCEGHQVQIETRLSKGYRVDILAEKESVVRAIEVKETRRGISDDISKCCKILRLPEVSEVYVAAPKLLVSPDHVAFAKSVGVGVIAITEEGLKWLLQSSQLKPPQFSGSSGYPILVKSGSIFKLSREVCNSGQKIARNLQIYCVPSGPFVIPPGNKRRFSRSYLEPGDKWGVEFTIRVRAGIPTGNYPLLTTAIADNIERGDMCCQIKVCLPENKSLE
jgi:Holliday junction resolvase